MLQHSTLAISIMNRTAATTSVDRTYLEVAVQCILEKSKQLIGLPEIDAWCRVQSKGHSKYCSCHAIGNCRHCTIAGELANKVICSVDEVNRQRFTTLWEYRSVYADIRLEEQSAASVPPEYIDSIELTPYERFLATVGQLPVWLQSALDTIHDLVDWEFPPIAWTVQHLCCTMTHRCLQDDCHRCGYLTWFSKKLIHGVHAHGITSQVSYRDCWRWAQETAIPEYAIHADLSPQQVAIIQLVLFTTECCEEQSGSEDEFSMGYETDESANTEQHAPRGAYDGFFAHMSSESALSDVSELIDNVRGAFETATENAVDQKKQRRLFEVLSGIMWFVLYDWPRAQSTAERIAVVARLLQAVIGIDKTMESFRWIMDMFQKEVEPQSGTEDMRKWLSENATDVQTGEAAHKTRKFVCALVSIAFSGVFDKSITSGWFSHVWSFASAAWRETSVIGTIFEYALWFMKNLRAWITGDKTLTQIFTCADKAADFDTRVARLDHMKTKVCSPDGTVSLFMYSAEVLLLKKQAETALRTCPKSYRAVLTRQLHHIMEHETFRYSLENKQAYRKSPACFAFVGGSSVGKTCMVGMAARVAQKAAGVEEGPEHVYTLDSNDEYMSEFGPGKNVIVIDDVGNTMPEFANKAASQQIIDIVNNQPRKAVMADLTEKGLYSIEPAVTIITSNHSQLNITATTCEPISVLRRPAWFYEIQLKPLDAAGQPAPWYDKGRLKLGADPAAYDYDIWKIIKFRWDKTQGGGKIDLKKIDVVEMSFPEMLVDIASYVRAHVASQDKFLVRMEEIRKAKMCSHGTYRFLCKEEHADGEEVEQQSLSGCVINKFAGHLARARGDTHRAEEYDYKYEQSYAKLKYRLYTQPAQMQLRYARMIQIPVALMAIKKKPVDLWQFLFSASFAALTHVTCFKVMSLFFCFTSFACWMAFAYFLTTIARVIPYLRTPPGTCVKDLVAMEMAKPHRRRQMATFKVCVAALGVAYGAYKLWSATRKDKLTQQGSEHSRPIPTGCCDTKNVYQEQYIRPVEKNVDVKTMSAVQLGESFEKHLLFGRFQMEKNSEHCEVCNVFPMESEHVVVPYHVVAKGYKWLVIHHSASTASNSTRLVSIEGQWRRVGDTDLAVIRSPVIADRKDFTPLLPEKKMTITNGAARFVWVDSKPVDGDFKTRTFDVRSGCSNTSTSEVRVGDKVYAGGIYTFPEPTSKGLCGAPVFTDKLSGPTLLGFHSAGVTGTTSARYCSLDREQYQKAKRELDSDDLTPQSQMSERQNHSERLDFEGTQWRWTDKSKPQATSLWVSGQYEQMGYSTAPSRTLRSNVRVTRWSEYLAKTYGLPRLHGPPKNIGNWVGWNMWLANVSRPSTVPAPLVRKAKKDYWDMLMSKISTEELKEKVSPLDHLSTINGVNGVKGCDPMKKNTSMGIPWCRPKKEYMRSVERVDNIEDPYDFTPEVMQKVHELESILAEGKRAYVAHRCNLKDEAIKIDKEKVRVFLGCPLPYLYLMRKYFLALVMFIQEHPHVFETAVGVNCYGQQWGELAEHIRKHGAERIVAGDYAWYDQMMEILVTKGSFEILIGLCEKAGYSERDLRICRGLMTETIAGCYDLRGEWIGLTGANPSGHALTVIINGVANSLYVRSAYYHLKPETHNEPFADCVSLMTYGDDNIMSVREDLPWFNHTTLSRALSEWNITYTMADKTAESVEYINLDQATFLKRSFVYRQGTCFAPLEEASIMKTLHTYLESKSMDVNEQHAQLLMNANREYFMYGEEEFNSKREMLMDLATREGIAHFFKDNALDTYSQAASWFALQ